MKFILSLDYELFFGAKTGTPDSCMLEPTRRLASIVERHGLSLCLFVDAAYLCKLSESAIDEHQRQFGQIADQLRVMQSSGHEVQLHIHSHWEDSYWRDGHWVMETSRYRLHDFDDTSRKALVKKYASLLERITGVRPVAYRAGGWCLQPFHEIAEALTESGIDVDSTVYLNGCSTNPGRDFDFRAAPLLDTWRFNDNPLQPVVDGRFVEVPISAYSVNPIHYWLAAANRVFGGAKKENHGDGVALANSTGYYLRKLFRSEHAVVSVDGSRAGYLESAWLDHHQRGAAVFNVMGHPKSITTESLALLDRFLAARAKQFEPTLLRSFSRTTQGSV